MRDALDAAGVGYRYLPPYSPDLNPIELAWSKLKTALRQAKARSLDQLDAELPRTLATITASDGFAMQDTAHEQTQTALTDCAEPRKPIAVSVWHES